MANFNFNNIPNPYQAPNYQSGLFNRNQYAFVNGIEGAKSYQVLPNQVMLLMDSDNPVCYMKQADQFGKATLRYFKLVELDEAKTKEFLEEELNKPTIEYALKSDIDSINNKLTELTKLIKKTSKGE